MKQNIIDFHKDSEGHWVADLTCGHKVHVRHNPPTEMRPWVLELELRMEKVGSELNCKRCDEMGLVIGKAVLEQSKSAVKIAWEEAGFAGICEEGKLELILDYLATLNLEVVTQKAISESTTELGTLS